MKVADLYVRVSTDEQADKGFSQRDQEERLRKHCLSSNISIRNVIYEDHSAKTFLRPEWEKYIRLLKKHKGQSDIVLFTKWDRFSRNAPDAYNMIAVLRALSVEPQAIEQPLDMTVPENKMMLAIYLTAPEIENDRRGLNTFYGLRRARKEGRWPGLAPVGYINRTSEDGRKFIMPDGNQADLMKWAFKEISKAVFSTEQIYHRAVEKGLKCSKNNFLRLVRNPIYMGLIQVSKYKDEEAFQVKGIHEPIISELLFYEVQDVLDGKKRSIKTKILSDKFIPLKGYLKCSECDRMLCGSASKGRTNYYYYYHCSSKCGCRFKASEVNEEFEKLLAELCISATSAKILKTAILDTYGDQSTSLRDEKLYLGKYLTELNTKLSRARELLLAGDIDSTDYKLIKAECESQIKLSEAKLNGLSANTYNSKRLEAIVDEAFTTLSNLNIVYKNAEIENKRRLIGSMFNEKITFQDLQHRTAIFKDSFEYIPDKQEL
jgi:DNA invertase Pin-like site-specific DNA recombinase